MGLVASKCLLACALATSKPNLGIIAPVIARNVYAISGTKPDDSGHDGDNHLDPILHHEGHHVGHSGVENRAHNLEVLHSRCANHDGHQNEVSLSEQIPITHECEHRQNDFQ